MPEDNAPEAAAPKPKGHFGLIVALIVLVVAAGGGLAVYQFVVAPMFAQSEEPPEQATDTIPLLATYFDFEEAQASVRQEDPAQPGSVLMYAVSFVCANAETQLLVEKNQQLFVSKLDELHRNRTKAELNDPQVEKEITRLALEEANSLLRRLQQQPDPAISVLEVLHLKFSVFDL